MKQKNELSRKDLSQNILTKLNGKNWMNQHLKIYTANQLINLLDEKGEEALSRTYLLNESQIQQVKKFIESFKSSATR